MLDIFSPSSFAFIVCVELWIIWHLRRLPDDMHISGSIPIVDFLMNLWPKNTRNRIFSAAGFTLVILLDVYGNKWWGYCQGILSEIVTLIVFSILNLLVFLSVNKTCDTKANLRSIVTTCVLSVLIFRLVACTTPLFSSRFWFTLILLMTALYFSSIPEYYFDLK